MFSASQQSLVGVGCFWDLGALKSQLLLVDQIALIYGLLRPPADPGLEADMRWLEARGVLYESNLTLHNRVGISMGGEILFDAGGMFSTRLANGVPISPVELMEEVLDYSARSECEAIRSARGVNAVSLRRPGQFFPRDMYRGPSTGDVLSIVLTNLPEPDSAVSLERILDFRTDAATTSKMIALRRWASKLTKANLPAAEIVEELRWLVNEYEEHMRLHKMKIHRGTFETVITAVAEAAEDLIKIRWGNLAKSLFSVSHKKIDLLEAELKAPGREIAYICHVNKVFKH